MHIRGSAFKQWAVNPSSHLVDFYMSEDSLGANLRSYVCSGLEQGDNCIVIATSLHIKNLYKTITAASGTQTSPHAGSCTIYNAEAVLECFMVGGLPDRELFLSTVGSIVAEAAHGGKPVRAYGEMVTVLWSEGNKTAAIALEKLWNELADTHAFALYCSYPERLFDADRTGRSTIEACHSHSMFAA